MTFTQKTSNFKKILLVLLAAFALGAGVVYYTQNQTGQIYTYQADKDRDFIIQLFKDNWYWLVSEYSKDFSPSYMLDYKASDKKPANINNLTIKVFREAGKPVGFVSFYMKDFFEGFVLFLAVDEKARQKGYARKLLRHAISELKKRGATHIRLITRTTNNRAQKLYESEGFKNIEVIDNAFIRYELDPATLKNK